MDCEARNGLKPDDEMSACDSTCATKSGVATGNELEALQNCRFVRSTTTSIVVNLAVAPMRRFVSWDFFSGFSQGLLLWRIDLAGRCSSCSG